MEQFKAAQQAHYDFIPDDRTNEGEKLSMGSSSGGKTTITRLLNGLAPAYYSGELIGEIWLVNESKSRFFITIVFR